MAIPPDTRAPGDDHHVEDHNAISDVLTAQAAAVAGKAGLLTPTAVKTSAYTASAGDFVPVDTTSGNVTITLPAAPPDLTVVAVKHVIQGSTNTVTITCGGSDVFNKTGGATTGTLTLLAQGMLLQYKASGGIWYITADDLPLSQLDARYTTRQAGTGGTAVAPLPFLNPKDYGAKFDGSTDDSTALNNAQTANTDLVFPPGTSIVTASSVFFKQSGERIRGAGMYATTVKSSSGSLATILGQMTSGYVSQVELSDMTIDGGSAAAAALHAYGWGIGRLTLRRVRFINFPGSIIDGGYASEFVIEDCEADGAGLGTASFFTATNKELDSVILRRNRLRWLGNGVIIGSAGFHAAYVEIDDNDFMSGWMHLKAQFTGSGGTVTYTSNSLTNSAAAFSGFSANSAQPVRAMPVLRTGTFTTVTGTHIADTAASFISAGVLRNHIIRSGASFAVVSNAETATTLHVREWLDQASYAPVAPPSVGASYTIYGMLFLNQYSSTGTSVTGQHGGSGGGGGWYDLTGVDSTPAAGTLYEVIPPSNYPVFLTGVTDKAQITNNRLRGGWSDQIEHFGTRAIITGNIVEDGNNYGIFTGSSGGTPVLDKSVISDNIIKHNALGLGITGGADVEVGPNQYEDNGWGIPSGNPARQILVSNSARVTITGGNASNTAECALSTAGLYISGASTADCKVLGFRGSGHALGDIHVETTVPAGVCELIGTSGTITYAGTTNGQRLQVKGSGAPALPASPGSSFLRTDGGAGTTLYVKETGNDNTGWTPVNVSGGLAYGQRVAYSAITAGVTVTGAASGALTTMTAFSGAPSITLPNDGHTYRVTLAASSVAPSAQQICAIGIGTATTTILKYTQIGYSGELVGPCFIQIDVVASGQVINCYAWAGSGGNVTLNAGANAPAELSAVLVAT